MKQKDTCQSCQTGRTPIVGKDELTAAQERGSQSLSAGASGNVNVETLEVLPDSVSVLAEFFEVSGTLKGSRKRAADCSSDDESIDTLHDCET